VGIGTRVQFPSEVDKINQNNVYRLVQFFGYVCGFIEGDAWRPSVS
jgi:hypothetical protein